MMAEGESREGNGTRGGEGVASRRLALEVLIQVEKEGAYANLALANAFKRKALKERDRAFVTALVLGVLRHRSAIDGCLSELSKQPLVKLPPTLRNVLRLGIYQLEYMTDLPARAVLDTSNNLARAAGHAGHAKYVNGVLRAHLGRQGSLAETVVDIKDAQKLATLHSMPAWLVDRWLERWGPEETQQLLKCTQMIPELVVRTCELSITPEGLKNVFESSGITCRSGRLVPSCLIIENRGRFKGPVDKLPGYSDGLFSVQDEAAAFVSRVVDPAPGELVVDLCAAPGGKSLHMAELMQNKGRVIAIDSHSGRLDLLRQSRQRLGLTNVEIMVADGRTVTLDQPADRILLDVPCTGTGVINRRSDLRYHRQEPDLQALVALQRVLLTRGAALVKPGGVLVYATCSMEPEENEENIQWFLGQNQGFTRESIEAYVPADLAGEWKTKDRDLDLSSGALQLLPSRHGQSGFYVCRLRHAIR